MTNPLVFSSNNTLSTEHRKAETNPVIALLASLSSEGSRKTYLRHLNRIADIASGSEHDAFDFPWQELNFQHTNALRAKLGEAYAPATANLMLSALRRVLYYTRKLKLMDADDYQDAVDLKNFKNDVLPKGRSLESGEIYALMETCEDVDQNDKNIPLAARDAALIGVLYGCGLRRSELVNLNIEDYETGNGQLKILKGKGGKQRIVYVKGGAARALADWLMIRGSEPGPLFLPIRRGGHIEHRRMTSQAVYNMLRKRGQEAGVDDFSPHDLRRTFVGDLLDNGVDISTVSKLTGHANIETTRRYDQRPERAKEKASELLHVPYNGKLNQV